MRGLAFVRYFELGNSRSGHRRHLDGGGVDHHGRVESVEGTAFEHEDLPAAALFGRGAEEGDGQPQVVGEGGQAEGGTDGAAAMMLWPHACPISGRASYSAQIPTCTGPDPIVARTAVGRP